jgi:16S rRNA (guanine(966)-N(2))-methyltransferase RsmD
MRVIAGEFRSRKILSVPGLETRPTPDRLRETLFNILNPLLPDAVFVDAYAGTGSVGIEALSRGARHAVFIEKSKVAVEIIQQNIASLKCEYRARVIRGIAPMHLGAIPADIVFLDPPYESERDYLASFESLEAKPPSLTVVQHSSRHALADAYGPLRRTRLLKQGDNALSFYKPDKPEPEPEPTSNS